uniref:Endonuclease domain-containing 1 protein-like n=1 Tax=Fundulus heteroclitus TaxID=8078 RepID=A0A3Q2QQA1_FUNHE
MSQRNFLLSFTAALLFLLPWFGGPVVGELSEDFSQCLQFFYNKTPPTGINGKEYQPICQRYKNTYRFASLYHRQHRAPLYSAYILSPADGKRPRSQWKYEPQLAFAGASPDMSLFNYTVDQNVVESQAVLWDYKNSGFTRGHLNPSLHQKTEDDRKATFTLTNIVPQKEGSNTGTWNMLENHLLNRFKNFCTGPMYVITGVMPYETVKHWIRDRVSVPEYMWSAYCCPSYKPNLPECMERYFPTFAAVGRNDPSSGEEIVPVNKKAKPSVRGYDVKQMPLQELEVILNHRLKMSVSLFDGKCLK